MIDENHATDENPPEDGATVNAAPELPEGGDERYFNAETGEYDWQRHALDVTYRFEQSKRDREAAAKAKEEEQGSEALYLDDERDGDGDGEQQEAATPKIDLTPFLEEAEQYGDLSDESYEKLEEMGLPRDLVEDYIANRGAAAERTVEQITGLAGGPEGYQRVIEWAAVNLEKDEIDAFNRLANGTDIGAFRLAVKSLVDQYSEQHGHPASVRIVGGGGGEAGGDVYADWNAVQVDMRDPRYKTDATFRDMVERKLSRSPLQGVRVVNDGTIR